VVIMLADSRTDRRSFIKTVGAAAVALGADSLPAFARQAAPKVRFGVDMFSVNQQNWTPFQQLDFAAKWNVNVVHFSEIRFLGSLEPDNLKRVRARADELNIDLEIGMRSICPTSKMFDKAQGPAEEQLGRMIEAAKIVRSPIVRAVLGSVADRADGIDTHIDDTVKVLKSMRGRLMDANVKVAIENHAGDMQARELKRLVESAGPEYVGVCLDSGNPVWTIEDPHLTLDTLAPYVLTSHMRDSALWNTPQGPPCDGRGWARATWAWRITSGPTFRSAPARRYRLK
jgi:3-oxoisoapionate decarboxylase